MEVSQDQLIDVGLNVIGFLAAGGLLLLISSLFRKDRAPVPALEAVVPTPVEPVTDPVTTPVNQEAATDMEFVSFSSPSAETAADSDELTETTPSPEVSRRDRSEIIRVAREMIQARRSTEEIADNLPISEAELAILSRNNTGVDGEDNG